MNREAQRQSLLMAALWRDATVPDGWLRTPARATTAQAMAAYQGHAGATAERALGAAFPTVVALVGGESFAVLARHFWHDVPPPRGDLGEWGAALPGFIAGNPQLADVPYLADSARLDWAVHQATRATDLPTDWRTGTAALLHALAHIEPEQLRLPLSAGAALVSSPFPVATLWLAHQGRLPFEAARAALAASHAEHAFVWRDAQYRVQVQALDAADAAFTGALLQRRVLSAALDEAGPAFAFDRWLSQALGAPWLGVVAVVTAA